MYSHQGCRAQVGPRFSHLWDAGSHWQPPWLALRCSLQHLPLCPYQPSTARFNLASLSLSFEEGGCLRNASAALGDTDKCLIFVLIVLHFCNFV